MAKKESHEEQKRADRETQLKNVTMFLSHFGDAEKALLKTDFPDITVQQFQDTLNPQQEELRRATQIFVGEKLAEMPLRSLVQNVLMMKKRLERVLRKKE